MTFALVDSRSVQLLLSAEELNDDQKKDIEKVLKRAKFVVADSAKMDSLPL
ncbi:MAG: hypothetical protein ACON5H_03545 [Akkermansiaceae bacterium]